MPDISSSNGTTTINESSILPSNNYISDLTAYGYYSLLMVICGTVFNLLAFVILCRGTFRDVQARPVLHYIRTIVFMDMLGVYGWNLDNYLQIIHGFTLAYSYTIGSCKFFSFFNDFYNESSAWIRVFICLDRYLALSRVRPNTWFNRSKNVLIIVTSTIVFFILFNLHFLIFVCYRDANGQIVVDSTLFSVYPTYSRVNMSIGVCLPFLCMILFNSASIYHLIRLRNTTMVQNSRVHHRAISITLILTSFLFILTNIPSKLGYGIFFETLVESVEGRRILNTFDMIFYTYPMLDFPIFLLTFSDFRHGFLDLVGRKRRVHTTTAQQTRPSHLT